MICSCVFSPYRPCIASVFTCEPSSLLAPRRFVFDTFPKLPQCTYAAVFFFFLSFLPFFLSLFFNDDMPVLHASAYRM
jgi:hypothetical protein